MSTFIVEDGTGLANANALASVAFVDEYHLDMGNADWSGTTLEKQTWIRKATQYIELRWSKFLTGIPSTSEQALCFPRLYVYDIHGKSIEGLPLLIQKATAEYSLAASNEDLFFKPENDSTGRAISYVRNKIGPIEDETRYFSETRIVYKKFPIADRYMEEFVIKGGKVIRA